MNKYFHSVLYTHLHIDTLFKNQCNSLKVFLFLLHQPALDIIVRNQPTYQNEIYMLYKNIVIHISIFLHNIFLLIYTYKSI